MKNTTKYCKNLKPQQFDKSIFHLNEVLDVFGSIRSQSLMMKGYKYCNKQIRTFDNDNAQSHEQDEIN